MLTLSVMVLPLLPALQEWLRPSDVAPLKIDESDALDPPGLAHGFAALPLELQALPPHLDRCRLMTVTAHRRENWGDGIQNIARAVARLLFQHDDLAVVWPWSGRCTATGRCATSSLPSWARWRSGWVGG